MGKPAASSSVHTGALLSPSLPCPQAKLAEEPGAAGAECSWPVIGCHPLWLTLDGGGSWEGQCRLINNTTVGSEGQESQEGEENTLYFLSGIE